MLELETEHHQLGVTIISLHGDLDGSTFNHLIDHAEECVQAGSTKILLDFTHTDYISSAGLVALQSILKLLRGEARPDLEHGWGAFDDLERDRESGASRRLKICNANDRIQHALEQVGFADYIPTYTSRRAAIISFT